MQRVSQIGISRIGLFQIRPDRTSGPGPAGLSGPGTNPAGPGPGSMKISLEFVIIAHDLFYFTSELKGNRVANNFQLQHTFDKIIINKQRKDRNELRGDQEIFDFHIFQLLNYAKTHFTLKLPHFCLKMIVHVFSLKSRKFCTFIFRSFWGIPGLFKFFFDFL